MSREREELLRLAERLADGRDLEVGDGEDRVAANLDRLARFAAELRRSMHDGDDPELECWGHLELLECVGEGSSGRVWRARDPVLQREVAVKLRRRDGLATDDHWAWIHEARRLARVRHPNVLAVHGADIHGGRAGLWSDWVDGHTLETRLETGGGPDWAEALRIACRLVDALAAIHAAGVIHGDIKPANVMLDDTGHVILMDFGAGGQEGLEDAPPGTGSPLYMAPEQLDGRPATPASDCYMLGVVLFRLFAGRFPVEADSPEALMRQHHAGSRCRPPRQLPRTLRWLLDDLLAFDPGDRPDAGNTRQRLDNIQTAPARRRRRLAMAAVIGALAIGLGVSLFALDRVSEQKRVAENAVARETTVSEFMQELLAAPDPTAEGADVRVRDLLDDAARRAPQRFTDQPAALATIYMTVGRSYMRLGLNNKARASLERALNIQRRLYGPEDARVLETEMMRLESRMDATDWAGLGPQVETLEFRARAALGPDHRVTVYIMLERANKLIEHGRGSAARDLLERVLAVRPVSDRANRSQHVAALLALGAIAADQGDSGLARFYYEQSLEITGKDDDSGLVNRIAARHGLISLLVDAEELAAATAQMWQLLPEIREQSGESAHNYQVVLQNLGATLNRQGRYEEGLEVLRRALSYLREAGREDELVAYSIRTNIANALAETGQPREAARVRRTVYEEMVENIGPEHWMTMLATINHTDQLIDDGDPGAVELARRNLGRASQAFGDNHPLVLEARELVIRAGMLSGETATGLERLETHCAEKLEHLGPSNSEVVSCRLHLAEALAGAGHLAAARQRLDALHAEQAGLYGPDDPRSREVAEALAGLPGSGSD